MTMSLRTVLSASLFAASSLLAAAAMANPVVGEPAPAFTLVDEAGNTHNLADYRGRVVVLEWTNPQCPFIVRHYGADTIENIDTRYDDAQVAVLAVNSSHFNTAADSAAWKADQGFAYHTLLDTDGTVGHLYGARTTPHMYVIDAEGLLRYAGAIDNDPRGNNDAPTNYVVAAVDALLAGQAPEVTATDAYGCSVKYED